MLKCFCTDMLNVSITEEVGYHGSQVEIFFFPNL